MIVSKKASEFFGSDADAMEKFKTISQHIFNDQRLEDELMTVKDELEHLKRANADMNKELSETKELMQSQIQDRERVLAYRAKRLEDVMEKYEKSQEMNRSLLEILQVGGKIADESFSSKLGRLPPSIPSVDVIESRQDARSDICHNSKFSSSQAVDRTALLFHSLSVCREEEYKQLYGEILSNHDNLTSVLAEREAQILALNKFGMEKQEMLATIAELEAQNQHIMEQQNKQVRYLEQKLLAEQKRWERDKIAAVESIQDTLKHELESQMSQTTESVARENKHYQMEIKYQNAQVEKILHAHDTLKAQYRQLRQDRQLQEQMIQKLSQKVAFFMQVVPKLQRQEMTVSNDSSHHGKTFRRIKDCTSLQQQTDQNFLPVVNHRTSESADSASCKAMSCRRSEQSMQSIMNATNDALESHIQKCLMQNWKADVDGKLKEYAGYRMEQTTSNGKWKSRSMQPSGILEEVKDSLLHKKTVSRPPIHAMNNYNARVKGKNELHRQVATRSTR